MLQERLSPPRNGPRHCPEIPYLHLRLLANTSLRKQAVSYEDVWQCGEKGVISASVKSGPNVLQQFEHSVQSISEKTSA